MITRIPEPGPFGAMVVLGRTGANTVRAAVILKAAYDSVDVGGDALGLVPCPDEAASAIRTADDPDPARGQADIAVEKAGADIVVEGRVNPGVAAEAARVEVGGVTWLARAVTDADLEKGDVKQNLFGWLGTAEEPRTLAASTGQPGDKVPPLGYGPQFNNVHRRGNGFVDSGMGESLPPGQVVGIYRGGGATPLVRFRLPAERYAARVRWWSGRCPDRAPRWATHRLSLEADTLIVGPELPGEAPRVTIVWRAGWNWEDHPADSYRAVEIVREED
ncbi:MAG TPA: hypothetical protein PKE40_03035 [Arachnia sp.]|nr:hypothetical protein [Arachnia sp.]HMT85304.1 hypothetical protein [Arachnia sp.]